LKTTKNPALKEQYQIGDVVHYEQLAQVGYAFVSRVDDEVTFEKVGIEQIVLRNGGNWLKILRIEDVEK